MNVISSALSNLSCFLQDHHVSFSNGLLILFTVGGEHIFKLSVFNCPPTQPEARNYALVFMVIPAIILTIMGAAVSNLTWRVLHGCWNRSEKAKNGFNKVCVCSCTVLSRSAVVPVAWVFLMFLDGNYYACMRAKEPGQKGSEEYKEWVSESQLISWIGLLVVVVISFIVIAFSRCLDSVTYEQYRYIHVYREAEEAQFIKTTQEHTIKLAKEKAESFVQEEKKLDKTDWDAISVVPDFTGDKLSPLQEWTPQLSPKDEKTRSVLVQLTQSVPAEQMHSV